MSGTYEDTFFEDLINRYDFIRYLTIGNLYPVFYSSEINEESPDSQCNFLSTGKNPEICDHRSLCISAKNALTYLHSMIHAKHLPNNSKWCQYLSYWIYDNVVKRETCDKNEQLYDTLKRIKSYYIASPDSCDTMNFNIDKEKFMNKKKLFLLSEILYLIKEEYEYISHVQINVYNQFFRECFVIYKKIISADNCNIKNEYKTELNDFIHNFNNAKAHLNGNNKEISLDDIKSFDESRCKQELNGKQAVEAPDRGEAQGVNEDEGNTGPKGEARAVVLEESSLEQVPGSRDGIDGPVVRMRDSGSDVFKEHTDENISNPVGTIVGTSLGFFVPLIIIYKFTPLGSWLNTKVLGRNKIQKNMERNNQHLLLNSTENREINLGESMYRIKYNS